jgi:hypothetical protein
MVCKRIQKSHLKTLPLFTKTHHSAQSKTFAPDAVSAQKTFTLAHHQRINMKSREVFHALMSSKGYTYSDLSMNGDKYINPAMQTKWNYFIAGWEMRGVCD